MSAAVDTVATDALAEFIDVWADGLLLDDLGERLTCREADALSDLLRAYGKPRAAKGLLDAHSRGDDEDDSHYVKGGTS